jgi:hypothetical protein
MFHVQYFGHNAVTIKLATMLCQSTPLGPSLRGNRSIPTPTGYH